MGKKWFCLWISLLVLCTCTLSAAAEQETQLIPMGITAGIQMEVDGLLVLGMAETKDGEASSAYKAGLRSGDLITHVGSSHVTTIDELRNVLNQKADIITLRFLRDGTEQQINMSAYTDENGQVELGVYLRSSISGIGTITYYDPAAESFGALGHGISDGDTGVLLPVKTGSIRKTDIDAIVKGMTGKPGEVKGTIFPDKVMGRLSKNTENGIFGVVDRLVFPVQTMAPIPAGSMKTLECGAAQLLSDVSGKRESYAIQIIHVFQENRGRDLLVQVTDDRLLNLTGGIVQGMSGSPILQSGRLVGAVTHVLVSDPTRGYGISIDHMLEAAA